MNYYKYREDNSNSTYIISDTFWKSFTMYIKRMADDYWLTEKFGYSDDDSGYKYNYNTTVINKRILEEIGIEIDFFNDEIYDKLKSEDALSLVEFFYLYISEPNIEHDPYNRKFASKFNQKKARYNYTIYINNLFKNYKHCYFMKNGQITKIVSEKLNKMYNSKLGKSVDYELNKMINNSFSEFSSVKCNTIDNALSIISNALERAKTLEGKKKQSVEKIISKIGESSELNKDISELIILTTKISNNYMIRHYETDKIKIKDNKIKEFLYYNYLNIIRLILSTYDIDI